MDKKDKMIFEDLAIQGNRWTQDPSGQTQGARQMTLLDLVRMSEPDKQHPNFVPSSQTPLHGSQNFLELLGDLFLQCVEVENAIHLVKKSPVLEDRTSSKAELEKMLKKSAFIKKLITSIGEDIDNFAVEKPTK